MDEPQRSALIELAEQEIARKIAVDCIGYLQEQKRGGASPDTLAERTNTELQMRLTHEMSRHYDAVKAQVFRLLGVACKKAGHEGAMP